MVAAYMKLAYPRVLRFLFVLIILQALGVMVSLHLRNSAKWVRLLRNDILILKLCVKINRPDLQTFTNPNPTHLLHIVLQAN